MKYLFIILLAIFFACNSEDAINKIFIPTSEEIEISFDSVLETITEGQSSQVTLKFNRETLSDGFVEISYATTNAVYTENFITQPAFTNHVLRLNYFKGTEKVSFNIQTLVDSNTENESIEFSLLSASSSIKFDSNSVFKIIIQDETEDILNDNNLTVVTWNIEHFPKSGNTIDAVKDIVLNMDADIIALQEMDDIDAFNTLVDAIDGWEGELYDVKGGIELAYLYKSSEITSFSSLSIIFPDDSYAFPRQPVLVTVTHSNGLEITLFNLHLKCCGVTGSDEANRREAASKALQEYINTNLPNDNVIVVGDWNDDIGDGPFDNFLSDKDNYLFADIDIASGSSSYWSYPSWPSHLDHILISGELIDNFVSAESLYGLNSSGYKSNVSDHIPVTATFKN